MDAREGWIIKRDEHTNILHYMPQNDRGVHQWDDCFCKPVTNKKAGTIHHNYLPYNKARC